jgi:predicted Zn-dependent peptidase
LPFLLLPVSLFSYDLESRVESHTLANGLRLLLLERHFSPTVSIYIRYRSGAVDEADGKTGAAHLLEHMMFKGTQTIGTKDYRREKRILDQIEAAGKALDRLKLKGRAADAPEIRRLTDLLASLQKAHRRLFISNEIDRHYTEQGAVDLNASTGQDLTTYRVSIPANRLELWARIESDRMANAVFRDFYTERDVVMEERRQRYETDPDGRLFEHYLATAFIAHPYRRPIIGWPSDLRSLDLGYLRRFFRNTHTPNNTVIAIVGDIEPVRTLSLVKRYFGGLPTRTRPVRLATEEPPQTGERRIEVSFAADPKLIMGYHKPAPPSSVDDTFDVIETLLSEGRTSRLFKSLVSERRIAENVQSQNGLPGARYSNQFVLFATPRHPHTVLELERELDREIERLKSETVPPEELEKVKNQLQADFIRGLNSNAGLAGKLSYFEALLGDYRYLTRYPARIGQITASDIQNVARTYLTRENRTIATLVRKP